MKKSLLALAVFGAFAGAASAQSSVTVYGVVDANVARTQAGADKVTSMNNGEQSQSRIGFKGVEDLGNGLKATFNLENGFDLSNGAQGQDSTLAFSRLAWVGLEGGFGTVRLGRQDLPIYLAMDSVDPFGTGTLGDIGTLFESLDSKPRLSNMLYYKTPTFAGFTVEGSYTFGETAGDNTTGSSYGVVGAYENGPLLVRLGYNLLNGKNATLTAPVTTVAGVAVPTDAKNKDLFAGASYDFGVVKLHAAYLKSKIDDVPGIGETYDAKSGMIGISVPLGAGTFLADFTKISEDKFAADNDSKKYSLGYVYSLSKRTNLYTTVARVTNGDDATRAAYGTALAGESSTGYQVGVRHTF
jgi:predicted porin